MDDWRLLRAYAPWFKKAVTAVGCGWLFLYPILALFSALFVPLSIIDSIIFILRQWYWGICGRYRQYNHTAGSRTLLTFLFVLLVFASLTAMTKLKSEESDWWWSAAFIILLWFPVSAALTKFIAWRQPSQKEIRFLGLAHERVSTRIAKIEAQFAELREVRNGETRLMRAIHDNLQKLEVERLELEKEKGDIAGAIQQRTATRIRLDVGWGMLSAIAGLIIFVSAGLADIVYDIGWLPILSQQKVVGLAGFAVSPQDGFLKASYRLVDAKNQPMAAKGLERLRLYDGKGNLIFDQASPFTKKGFRKQSKERDMLISKSVLRWTISTKGFIGRAVMDGRTTFSNGRGVLEVTTNNGETTLMAEYSPVRLYSAEEVDKRIIEIYYAKATRNLQTELDKQWPFKVEVTNYIMLENYGWALVRRTGTEIIIPNPLGGGVYDWYLLHSRNGGKNWDIAWRDDQSPRFKVYFLNEVEVQVTIPNATFRTTDEGKTWKTLP